MTIILIKGILPEKLQNGVDVLKAVLTRLSEGHDKEYLSIYCIKIVIPKTKYTNDNHLACIGLPNTISVIVWYRMNILGKANLKK